MSSVAVLRKVAKVCKQSLATSFRHFTGHLLSTEPAAEPFSILRPDRAGCVQTGTEPESGHVPWPSGLHVVAM